MTIKALMSYQPDGMDRLTVILGKGTPYDYQLLHDDKFRFSELEKFVQESKSTTN
ncbi:hypothetical protein HOB36_00200 [Candidatus Bathyarchaeota archaeon]|nr:hypothetical protein [Candidatus Bathyarchaeota archaeon]